MQYDRSGLRAATCVVVPAYREAAMIGAVVHGLRQHGWDALVVDDGSPDETSTMARAAGATVITHPINRGQGAALRTGFAYALGRPEIRYVVTFDADGQHPPESIERLLGPLNEGIAEVSLGSRFLSDTDFAGMPATRRMTLRLATRLGRWTTGLAVTDAHNGLRAISSDALRRMELFQDRMAHASEIQMQVARLRLRWVEVPVTVQYTEYSMGKGQRLIDAVNILWDLALAPLR